MKSFRELTVAAMADARRNLHADEDYLAARLGLAALAH